MNADLSEDEVRAACFPLKQKAAMVRHLQSMGLRVDTRPDGFPLVNRVHYNDVRSRPMAPGEAAKLGAAANEGQTRPEGSTVVDIPALAEWRKNRSARHAKKA